MLKIKFIVMGALGEKHWRDACDEYKKRMGASYQVAEIQLKEIPTPKNPSEKILPRRLIAKLILFWKTFLPEPALWQCALKGNSFPRLSLLSLSTIKQRAEFLKYASLSAHLTAFPIKLKKRQRCAFQCPPSLSPTSLQELCCMKRFTAQAKS